ncbi:unnamed protein product [Miscanthus lutarioriparius]|uniref:Bowman-Birk serine protease inhibitors family domain-containing protein n=1 Tax=Miscanthus lutarioriparius TaxID=422564 RepID=A0A811QA75_9POAL|nr:unnamed protein product [Miscanthus lutarioriparius]
MRPQVILVALAVLGVLAALPLGKGNKEEAGAAVAADAAGTSSWPCCDDCRLCNRKNPPDCQCNDISLHGCRPECKKCVRYTLTADDDGIQMPATSAGPGPVRTYRCADVLTNFCERRCTPAPAAAFLGEAF